MAAGEFYQGHNLRFKFDGKVLWHSTSCKLSISTKLEDIATKDTEGTVSTPGNYAWSLSAEALVADIPSGDSATKMGSFDMVDLQLSKTPLEVEFSTFVNGDKIYSGQVFIEQADIDASNDTVATGSFSFKGNGDLTPTTVA